MFIRYSVTVALIGVVSGCYDADVEDEAPLGRALPHPPEVSTSAHVTSSHLPVLGSPHPQEILVGPSVVPLPAPTGASPHRRPQKKDIEPGRILNREESCPFEGESCLI